MGDQRGAGIVDERIDLLSLLAAGFDLENTRTLFKLSPSSFSLIRVWVSVFCPHLHGGEEDLLDIIE